MSVHHQNLTVGTSATKASIAEVVRSYDKRAQSCIITAAAAVYVGGPGVTTTDYGYKIDAGASLALDLGPDDGDLYLVAAAPTAAHILYLGVTL